MENVRNRCDFILNFALSFSILIFNFSIKFIECRHGTGLEA